MEFEGTVLQPNFREKEKRYKATILGLENTITELKANIVSKDLWIEKMAVNEQELKDEIKQLKIKHRNFKARVTGKE
jgi:hypothetical protein